MTITQILDYKGNQLKVEPRSLDGGFVANLDIILPSTGHAFRRWWPAPFDGSPHPSVEKAVEEAFNFARRYIDDENSIAG